MEEEDLELVVIGDKILVELQEAEEQTSTGLFLPQAAQEDKKEGMVVRVGQGYRGEDGTWLPLQVVPGDIVLFSPYGGTKLEEKGTEYLLLREPDILAIRKI